MAARLRNATDITMATSLTVAELPVPTFQTPVIDASSSASRIADTTSETWMKSRSCEPSP